MSKIAFDLDDVLEKIIDNHGRLSDSTNKMTTVIEQQNKDIKTLKEENKSLYSLIYELYDTLGMDVQ
jgi:flagellar capping protein FliD